MKNLSKRNEWSLLFIASTLILVFLLFPAIPAHAEMAAPGEYLSGESLRPLLFHPPGKYRTRLGLLFASLIKCDEELGVWDYYSGLKRVTLDAYRAEFFAELEHIASLKGRDRFIYLAALMSDIAKAEIQHLNDNSTIKVAEKASVALAADVLAYLLIDNLTEYFSEAPVVILEQFEKDKLNPKLTADMLLRYNVYDLNLRYDDIGGPSLRALTEQLRKDGLESQMKAHIEEQIKAYIKEQVTDAFLYSIIGTPAEKLVPLSSSVLTQLRRQLAMEVAGFQCACALDPRIFRPPATWEIQYGGSGKYRTKLGYILSLKLAPPRWTVTNVWADRTPHQLLLDEVSFILELESENRIGYLSYMRSFLVDLEDLEAEQVAGLESSWPGTFLQNNLMNLVFNAIGSAVPAGLGVAPSVGLLVGFLLNAGYEGLQAYDSLSKELKIRTTAAAIREPILDLLIAEEQSCGCGAGVIIAPNKVYKGKVK